MGETVQLEEVDNIDFNSFMNDINNDITSLSIPESTDTSNTLTFGSYDLGTDSFGDLNIGSDHLNDLGPTPKSIFDSHVIELDKIKKVSSPKPTTNSVSNAPIPVSAPLPSGAPIPAPLPGAAPMPSGAAPLPSKVAPMAAPLPTGSAPMAPMPSSAPIPAPMPSSNVAPMAAPMAPIPSSSSKVQLSDVEKQNISNAKSQFSSSDGTVPLLMQQTTNNENVRHEDYDKIADIAYNKDAAHYQSEELNAASKVSKFGGLQSSRKIISKTKEEEEYLSKAKGKVTKFSGLDQSSRKIITADEEEQKRIAQSRLVQKQKSMFNSMGKQKLDKKVSIVHDKNITDAASAAKNMFKAMEKQNTLKNVKPKK